MIAPSACALGTRQAHTWAPSSSTVQAPQSPASQPILVPVRPSSPRSVSASETNGAAAVLAGLPFSVKEMRVGSSRVGWSCIRQPSA